jgi:hypothetical protein
MNNFPSFSDDEIDALVLRVSTIIEGDLITIIDAPFPV